MFSCDACCIFSQVYTEVLSLGRRTTTIPDVYKATESDLKKLKQEIVGMKDSVKVYSLKLLH